MSRIGLTPVDVNTLAGTWSWWKRGPAWLLWHIPVLKHIAGLFTFNPFGRVVALCRPSAEGPSFRRTVEMTPPAPNAYPVGTKE